MAANSIEYNAANYMDKALAPVALSYKQDVLQATWGHLAPKKNRKYRGYIVFTITNYNGAMEIIDADFGDLSDSPWLFDAMNDFVFEDWQNMPQGVVFKFEGTFRNYKFEGTRTVLYAPPNAKE